MNDVDILIIGGGLTGAALMLALQHQGLDVLLIDSHDFQSNRPPDSHQKKKPITEKASYHFDARSLALAPASVNILEKLDVWSLIASKATPIHRIHVSQQGRFGVTRLKSTQPDLALGQVVELQDLGRAIHQRLDHTKMLAPAELIGLNLEDSTAKVLRDNVELTIRAQLIVAADGGHSTVREWSALPVNTKTYPQKALIANIALKRGHGYCAYERFTPDGPLAMLPMTHSRAALVWCLPPDKAKQQETASDKDFLKALQEAFGYRLGRFTAVGARTLFPLQEMVMPKQIKWPLVFIGNAAHTLHPVAGQGFNLGLRDVATLAQCILQYGLNKNMLAHYQSMRASDQATIIQFTDGLIELFGSQWPGLGIARSLGLFALDNMKLLQTQLSYYARGFGGAVPDLVCGISLKSPEG